MLSGRRGYVATQCENYSEMTERNLRTMHFILRVEEKRRRKDEELRRMEQASSMVM